MGRPYADSRSRRDHARRTAGRRDGLRRHHRQGAIGGYGIEHGAAPFPQRRCRLLSAGMCPQGGVDRDGDDYRGTPADGWAAIESARLSVIPAASLFRVLKVQGAITTTTRRRPRQDGGIEVALDDPVSRHQRQLARADHPPRSRREQGKHAPRARRERPQYLRRAPGGRGTRHDEVGGRYRLRHGLWSGNARRIMVHGTVVDRPRWRCSTTSWSRPAPVIAQSSGCPGIDSLSSWGHVVALDGLHGLASIGYRGSGRSRLVRTLFRREIALDSDGRCIDYDNTWRQVGQQRLLMLRSLGDKKHHRRTLAARCPE